MPQPKKTEAAQQKDEPGKEPAVKPATPPADDTGDGTQDQQPAGVEDAMSTEQLKAAGIPIDVPWECPEGSPAPLQYGDLGPDKGWAPPEGFTIAGVPFADVLAGVGGGAAHTAAQPEMELPPEDPEQEQPV